MIQIISPNHKRLMCRQNIDLLFLNFVIILITYGLEKFWLLKHESSKMIVYEKINLIKEGNYKNLLKTFRKEQTLVKSTG
jgi:hypothetical protein